jgi:cell division protease FtsH
MPLSDKEALLRVAMGGSAAELTVLEGLSSGAEDDYRRATEVATQMVAHWGMSEELGPVYYRRDEEHPFLGRDVASQRGVSDLTTRKIEQQVHAVLTERSRPRRTSSRSTEEPWIG